jgi:hypothetical protein
MLIIQFLMKKLFTVKIEPCSLFDDCFMYIKLKMYCVFVSTRIDFKNFGYCYDIINCISKEDALDKLFNYHKSNCNGSVICQNCYFHDNKKEAYKDVIMQHNHNGEGRKIKKYAN